MAWLKRLIHTISPSRLDHDLDEELRFHLEMRTEEHIRGGMSPSQGRAKARERFGNHTYIKESTRDMNILVWLESIRQDIGYSLRMMRRSPSLTAAVVLSLVLGIGANTAIFSIMDAALLKSLPVRNPGEIVLLTWNAKKMPRTMRFFGNLTDAEDGGTTGWSFSSQSYERLQQSLPDAGGVAAFQKIHGEATVFAQGRAETANGELVSGNYFETLGLVPHTGRLLHPPDDNPGAAPAVVLSYPFWNRMFGGDPAIIGEAMKINGYTCTIVGVTRPGFFGLSPGNWPDFFLPLAAQDHVYPISEEGPAALNERLWWLQLVARKKSDAADRDVQALWNIPFQQSLASLGIETPEEQPILRLERGSRGYSFVRDDLANPLWILMALAGLVLLITCADVANLLLARATSRYREAAMRAALGAGRPRLIRQHLTESLLLALLGGVGGVLLAKWCGNALIALATSTSEPLAIDLRYDWRFFSFALVLALVTGLLFGLVPAFRSARTDLMAALQHEGRTVARGWTRRFGFARVLVASQIAVSLVVVIAAGLFLRSLDNLYSIPLGFQPDNLLLFDVNPLRAGYSQGEKNQLLLRLSDRLEAIPGVSDVTWSRYALIANSAAMSGIRIPDPAGEAGDSKPCYLLPVGPGFHETMRIPILLGRSLGRRDDSSAPRRAVVNQTFVDKYLPDTQPIGRRFVMTARGQETTVEIVGVAGDARYDQLRHAVPPTAYLPDEQMPSQSAGAVLELRTDGGPPKALITAVRSALREIDPYLPAFNIRTQQDQINEHLRQERLISFLAGSFAALAMLLAAIGLYGVIAYSVSRRTGEIGVRMALGATRRSIRRLVLRDGALVVLPGAFAGLGLALAATRVIRSFLYGLDPADPLTIAAATAALLAIGFLAGFLPAQRAARIDPLDALRHE
jgi:predicted permease